MVETNYTEPVARLLDFGDCLKREKQFRDPERDRMIQAMAKSGKMPSREEIAQLPPMPKKTERWPNYLEDVGFTAADVPELIRMATDSNLDNAEEDSLEVWAPVHAWRSLGQLGAKDPSKVEDAIAPLIKLIERNREDDWVREEIPHVLSLIGEAAIAPLQKALSKRSKKDWARISYSESLERIAITHPALKEQCVEIVAHQLEDHVRNPTELNAFMVSTLIKLEAKGKAEVIERAYQAGRVAEEICGTWPNVQVDLGLAKESDFSPEELKLPTPEWALPRGDRKPSADELGLPTKYEPGELSVAYGEGKSIFGKQKAKKKSSQGFGASKAKPSKFKKKKK